MIPLRDSQPSRHTPVVTILLIAINAAIFFFQISLSGGTRRSFMMEYAMIPARLEWFTLATSMFLHGGWLHIIGNMWFLWIFGDNVEDILGRARFLVFYLASGVAAALVHLMFSASSTIPVVGASGAIAGVMGAYMIKFPHSRILTLIPIFIFVTRVEIPAGWMLAYWLAIQIFSGVGEMAAASANEGGGIAWWAHAGGFLAGIVLIKIMKTRRPHWGYGETFT
jgi:membrane associated rhomboid family serine protease